MTEGKPSFGKILGGGIGAILGIGGCVITLMVALFGDNAYEQITGHSIFQQRTNESTATIVSQSTAQVPQASTSAEAPTSVSTLTAQESPQPTSITPTRNPLCDTSMFVREPTTLGAEKTYIRCPIGQVEYLIQTDDLLTSIVIKCPGSEAQSIDFSLDETLSQGALLPTFRSDRFSSAPGCEVFLTIADTNGDQIGYTIRQEIVSTR